MGQIGYECRRPGLAGSELVHEWGVVTLQICCSVCVRLCVWVHVQEMLCVEAHVSCVVIYVVVACVCMQMCWHGWWGGHCDWCRCAICHGWSYKFVHAFALVIGCGFLCEDACVKTRVWVVLTCSR